MKESFLLFLVLIPGTILAVDGVKEINQTCAQIGCFPGDGPGFPVEITERGSYVLTGNLDVSGLPNSQDITGIRVTSPQVALDMNGFGIRGPVTCSGTPVTSCSPSGTGDGIQVVVTGRERFTVTGGFVEGMGGDGVFCRFGCTISDLEVSSNGETGIRVFEGRVDNSTSSRNGGRGFSVGGVVTRSSAVENAEIGLFADTGVFTNIVSRGNGGIGVDCNACTLTDSLVSFNAGIGVRFLVFAVSGGNNIFANDAGQITGSANVIQSAPSRCGSSPC